MKKWVYEDFGLYIFGPDIVCMFSTEIWGEICMILGMNRVAMARNGLKLWENGARRSRKAMGYLPELWDSIKNQKLPEAGNREIPCIYIYGVGGMGGAL